MSDGRIGAIVSLAAVSTATVAFLWLFKRNRSDAFPKKWKKVGQVSDLNCFPLKSCAPIKRQSFNCHYLGLQYEQLFDRCFVITHLNQPVTARCCPKLLRIQSKLVKNVLILSAPNEPDFILSLDHLKEQNSCEIVDLTYSVVSGVDAGDEVADWLSKYIFGKRDIVRLIYYPHLHPSRGRKKEDIKKYKAFNYDDVGIYHDGTSYTLMNEASIDELNSRLKNPVKPLQFRANLIVTGPDAYEEDRWKWIRVGDTVVFRVIKLCQRCILVNMDPDLGESSKDWEPLATLIKKRTLQSNEPPVMGINLAIRMPGIISVGDPIYVNDDS